MKIVILDTLHKCVIFILVEPDRLPNLWTTQFVSNARLLLEAEMHKSSDCGRTIPVALDEQLPIEPGHEVSLAQIGHVAGFPLVERSRFERSFGCEFGQNNLIRADHQGARRVPIVLKQSTKLKGMK